MRYESFLVVSLCVHQGNTRWYTQESGRTRQLLQEQRSHSKVFQRIRVHHRRGQVRRQRFGTRYDYCVGTMYRHSALGMIVLALFIDTRLMVGTFCRFLEYFFVSACACWRSQTARWKIKRLNSLITKEIALWRLISWNVILLTSPNTQPILRRCVPRGWLPPP